MKTDICKVCGRAYDLDKPHYAGHICSDACFNKNFWEEKIAHLDEHPIIDGVCYHLDRKNLHGGFAGFKGFGGRRFKIKFLATGEVVETTNLWHNGEVPAEYRDRMPDSAVFVWE